MAKRDFYIDIDMNGNQILESTFEHLSAAPSNPFEGQNYYDTTLKINRHWNGTQWVSGGGGGGTSMTPSEIKAAYESNPDTNAFTDAYESKLNGIQAGATANSTDAQLRDRSTHTGTQAATTIAEDSTHRFATDAEKATWNAKQNALGYTPENAANKGQANGYVPLNSSSQIPQQYLPSFVDDILEFANLAAFPATGETGKIYIAIDTGRQYRWSGSAYIQITNGLIASTDDLPEGSTNKYSTNNRVLNYVLTGLTAAASRVLPDAADSIITAWGKVLKYLTDLGTAAFLNVGTTAGTVRAGDDLRFKDLSSYRKTGTVTLERWYNNSVSGYIPTAAPYGGNVLRGIPIVISDNQSWDRIGLEVTTIGSAGSVIRLGLYDSVNTIPTNLIADYGTVPGDTLGVKTIIISQTLTPGLYFIALNHNSTGNIFIRSVSNDASPPVLGLPATFGTTLMANSITSNLTYTTMPSTFTTSGMAASGASYTPDIRVRLS